MLRRGLTSRCAQVVELVDTLVSGASAKSMLVRVQSWAPLLAPINFAILRQTSPNFRSVPYVRFGRLSASSLSCSLLRAKSAPTEIVHAKALSTSEEAQAESRRLLVRPFGLLPSQRVAAPAEMDLHLVPAEPVAFPLDKHETALKTLKLVFRKFFGLIDHRLVLRWRLERRVKKKTTPLLSKSRSPSKI